MPPLGGRHEDVGAGPAQVLRPCRQGGGDRRGVGLGVQMAVPLGEAGVPQRQEGADDGVDVGVEDARVKVGGGVEAVQ